ncbi:MAG: T9SS type A sorting domain-containing protein [Bacteroidetes bacterium]|nr:T9SS type A sorting domain-containing protein [Bacteroidota bacterium]
MFPIYAQNTYNPYPDLTGDAEFNYGAAINTGLNDGEYQFIFRPPTHRWQQLDPNQFALSYRIEVLSFPFTPDIQLNNARVFNVLSDAAYNPLTNSWNINFTLPLFGNVFRSYEGTLAASSNNAFRINESSTLVSAAFSSSNAISGNWPGTTNRIIYPHTILKHTIYVHCGSDWQNDPIIDELSFVIDHTRGKMKEYPFVTVNYAGSQTFQHDINVFPELFLSNDYNQNTDPLTIGTIDYFPVAEPDFNLCNGQLAPNPSMASSSNPMNFIHPAPYSLTGFKLLDALGDHQAGYNVNSGFLSPMFGILHTYNVNESINLSIINPSEKIIYNPSEVTLTYQGQIVFPDHYTFKTIRGLYPTATEVNNANTIANCGPYTDLRDVPVPTDLSPTTDPTDASLYHIENGSSIVVNPCVKIFDATFNVKAGGTFTYMNRSTNCGRWKVQNLGTVIERNSNDIYLQNATINQGKYQYESKGIVYAGKNVNPDITVTQGNYIVDVGAEVVCVAENKIILKDGFKAKDGSKFHAYTTLFVDAPPCPPMRLQNNAGSGNDSQEQEVQANNNPRLLLSLSPNPSNGIVHSIIYDANDLQKINYNLSITNIMGNEIYHLSSVKSQMPYDLDLSKYPKGLYFVKVQSINKIFTEKIIIQ